jgi:Tfp pilus assembly protein PilV
MHDTLATKCDPQRGAALLELFMGTTVLVVGSLALLTSLFTSARIGRDARFRTLARNESMTVMEEFRNRCSSGFAATVTEYSGREIPCQSIARGKVSSILRTEIAMDETALSPPMDLNGDGDVLDASLTANELAVACVTTKVSWQNGRHSDTFATVFARADIGAPGDQMPGPPGATARRIPGLKLDSSKVSATQVQAKVTTDEALNVAGMTIQSSVSAYVQEIEVNGKVVFTQTTNLPPTGQMIVTSPFTMPAGRQSVDYVSFVGTPTGGKTDVSDSSLSIEFHTESGDRLVVIE